MPPVVAVVVVVVVVARDSLGAAISANLGFCGEGKVGRTFVCWRVFGFRR